MNPFADVDIDHFPSDVNIHVEIVHVHGKVPEDFEVTIIAIMFLDSNVVIRTMKVKHLKVFWLMMIW